MPDFNCMWTLVICLQYKHCKYCEEHFSRAWQTCEISHSFWLWSLTTEQHGTGGLGLPSLCSAPVLLLSKFLQLHSYSLLGNYNLFPFLKYLNIVILSCYLYLFPSHVDGTISCGKVFCPYVTGTVGGLIFAPGSGLARLVLCWGLEFRNCVTACFKYPPRISGEPLGYTAVR